MRAAWVRGFQTVMMIVLLAAPAFAQAPAQPPATPPPAQDGFQPFVPGQGAVEQLPATPLVFTAYALVWIILVLYVWSIWRRLGRVETEVRALQQQKGGARRP